VTVLAASLVGAVLLFAIARPRGLPEIVVAGPAAVAALALGLVTVDAAQAQVLELLPTVIFLAFVLMIAYLADTLGVFSWMAATAIDVSQSSPRRLLAAVFAAASLTTAVLSLDATVVLLTPAVIGAARVLRTPARPYSYATAHLANSASTLLPVSNLTNLLAFAATGLTFAHFAMLMALPWAVAIAIEFVVFRIFFRHDLARQGAVGPDGSPTEAAPDRRPAVSVAGQPAPKLALAVLATTLLGFGAAGFVGIEPFWVAAAGAGVLAAYALRHGYTAPTRVLSAADPMFCGFVLLLGVVVLGVTSGPIGDWLTGVLPTDTSLTGLLVTALIGAAASNIVNNLPATLLLLAALGPSAPPGLVLAMIIGVNLGPNLTYVGSLAIMLWRRVTSNNGEPASLGTFTLLGSITTPLTILGSVAALWLALGAQI
jgi:arsenical pump membrane protein